MTLSDASPPATQQPSTALREAGRSASHDRLPPGSALVIGLLMGSAFVVLLNEMMLGVALPTLIADLGITPTTGQWLTTGYLLVLAVLIPATGFVMRRFHLRAIFLVAMSLFLVGTAIAALAPGFGVLFLGRIIQAVGTAVFLPLLMTTTMRLVPASRRGQMMAVVTAVPAVAPAVGPALSGLVLSQLSWRWLFIVMLPIAAAAIALGAAKLENSTTPEPVTLDVASIALSAIGFGALVYGLASIGEATSGHAPIPPAVAVAVGLAGVAAFVLRQIALQRRDDAFLDMRIFRFRSFVLPLLVMVFVAMNGFGAMIVLPLFLASALGLSTLALGLFLVPGGAMISLVSALGGRIYDRVGPRPLAIPGAIIWTSSLWFLSTVDQDTSVWTVLAAYLVWTGSQALMWAPMTTAALAGLPTDLYSHGTAAFSTVQQLAGAAGGAILISAYTIGADAADAGNLSLAQTVTASQTAFTAAGIIALGALIGTAFVGRARAATGPTPPESGRAHSDVAADALSAR